LTQQRIEHFTQRRPVPSSRPLQIRVQPRQLGFAGQDFAGPGPPDRHPPVQFREPVLAYTAKSKKGLNPFVRQSQPVKQFRHVFVEENARLNNFFLPTAQIFPLGFKRGNLAHSMKERLTGVHPRFGLIRAGIARHAGGVFKPFGSKKPDPRQNARAHLRVLPL
jgi:hypothetical protein